MNILQASHSIAPAVEFIETATIYATKAYAFASEIFTVSAMLWCLNFMGNMIQKVYQFGYAFGKFYREFMHEIVKESFAFIVNRLILVVELTIEGAQLVYANREEIIAEANNVRNAIGRSFSYVSPTV